MKNRLLAFLMMAILAVGTMSVTAMATERTTWNPESITVNAELTDGNLTATTWRNDLGNGSVSATKFVDSGKWYWEVTLIDVNGTSKETYIGVTNFQTAYASPATITACYRTWGAICSESLYNSGRYTSNNGDVIGIALNCDDGEVTFYKNGTLLQTTAITVTSTMSPFLETDWQPFNTEPAKTTTNFGASEFAYDIPEGYLPYDEASGSGTTPSAKALAVLLEVAEQIQLSVSNDLLKNMDLTWTSMNESVVTVDANGMVTAIGVGFTQVYARNDDGFEEFINFEIILEGEADELRLAVDLNEEETARLRFRGAENITWTSMTPAIATVDNNGAIIAMSPGLTIIQAESGGETEIIYVRVR